MSYKLKRLENGYVTLMDEAETIQFPACDQEIVITLDGNAIRCIIVGWNMDDDDDPENHGVEIKGKGFYGTVRPMDIKHVHNYPHSGRNRKAT